MDERELTYAELHRPDPRSAIRAARRPADLRAGHPGLRRPRPRLHPGDPGGIGQARLRGAGAAERRRRPRGLPARERGRAHPDRLSRGVRRSCATAAGPRSTATGLRRPGPAAHHAHRDERGLRGGEHGAQHVPGPDPRRLHGDPPARHRRAEADVAAQARDLRVDRHDEPDRAALRHRPGADAHQGRAAGRRQLPHHRAEDLHLGRRARHGRQHRPPGAGQDPGRARRDQGRLALHRAEVPGERGRQPRRPQRRLVRQARGEDGHPRQLHLRDELRRRRGLPAGRGAQGHAGDVHDDERGPAGRRPAGAGPGRGRLPERARLRQATGCRAATSPGRRTPTAPPTRSSSTPTCGGT